MHTHRKGIGMSETVDIAGNTEVSFNEETNELVVKITKVYQFEEYPFDDLSEMKETLNDIKNELDDEITEYLQEVVDELEEY